VELGRNYSGIQFDIPFFIFDTAYRQTMDRWVPARDKGSFSEYLVKPLVLKESSMRRFKIAKAFLVDRLNPPEKAAVKCPKICGQQPHFLKK